MQLAPLAASLSLFGATFLQEGIALAGGAAAILSGTLSAPLVALSLFAGMVTGDCCIYGLGRLAHQSASARRVISGIDLNKAEAWLNKRLLVVVPACHLVPWLLFPTFVSLGWLKVPFARFASTSIGFNALYVPLALFVLTQIGGAAQPYLTAQPWVLWIAGAVVLTALIALRFRRAAS